MLEKPRLVQKQEPILDLSPKQRIALHALQKQKQVIELKEWLFMLGFIGIASTLRVLMQPFPNVEPLAFFALLSGWLFGWKKGALTGISSLYLSNFLVLGGQGPWTIFQVLGYGLVGFLGGFLGKKAGILSTMLLAFGATLMLQIIFNIGWSVFMGFNVVLAMFTGLPFALVHIISNTAFAAGIPKAREVINKIGKFDEKELCNTYISSIISRVPKRAVQ